MRTRILLAEMMTKVQHSIGHGVLDSSKGQDWGYDSWVIL